MARKLRATVHIPDGDGTLRTYSAGSVPPDDVAAQIKNPDVWEEDLESATKELLEKAERRGVEVKKSAKKDEIVQALEESAGG